LTHDLLARTVLALACLPFMYYLVAAQTARRFFRLRRASDSPEKLPQVSILKPVRGLDRNAFEHFASLCRQDYPEYEILFAVADEDDPAIPVIRHLIDHFPHRTIRLVVGAPQLGLNSKVNKLCRLARDARHDLLVVSDSDVSVPTEYLRVITAAFREPHVGLVTCLYRGESDGSLVADLEAIGISTDFVPGVLVAQRIEGVAFALGATMAVKRSGLAEIGGFEALVEYLADDFELGRRIAGRGYRVEVATCVVSTECGATTLTEFLRHELRWAVTVRHARPWSYCGKLLATQGLPWSVAAAFVAPSAVVSAAYLVAYLTLRLSLAWVAGAGLADEVVRRRWWLVPVWDAIGFFVTLAALGINRIDWRGRHFEVQRGKLVSDRRC
jgi:ceramide glucosyltransferase